MCSGEKKKTCEERGSSDVIVETGKTTIDPAHGVSGLDRKVCPMAPSKKGRREDNDDDEKRSAPE
jgi:hypothetical protein